MEEREAPATPHPRGRATEARSPGGRSLLTSQCKGPWWAREKWGERGGPDVDSAPPLCPPAGQAASPAASLAPDAHLGDGWDMPVWVTVGSDGGQARLSVL